MLVLTFFLLALLNVIAVSNEASRELNQKQLPVTEETTLIRSTNVSEAAEDSLTTTKEITIEPISYSTGTCDSNDTECGNVNVTTISPIKNDNETNKTANEKNQKPLRSKILTDTNVCTCDLQVYFCDINCCCDPDCSPNDKTIFGYCKIDANNFYDTKYCSYIKYIYVNNTPFKWEFNRDGLFCVINSNLPETYLIQKEELIDSIETINVEKKFWNEENDNILKLESQFGSKNYGFGDSIMIVREDSSIDNFRLPRNIFTSSCIFEEDVYYLKDVKNTCSQITIDDDNAKLNFSFFFNKFKFVGSPIWFNTAKLKSNIFKECPNNICIDIEPKLCNIHFTNCTDVEDNTSIRFHCSYDIKKNLNTCQNAVEKIHYKFYHNGTEGLGKVEVLGVLKNLSYHFGRKDFKVFQDFSVEFTWINQKKNHSLILSGNPGYITGKPILVGTQTVDESSTFIQRNSPSFLENFLVFPANVAGVCVRNDTYNTPIEFEYNMVAKCQLQRKLAVTTTRNATDICRSIQENIFDLWNLKRQNNKSLVIGLFGNANTSNIQDWTAILYNIKPKDFLNFIEGNFTNKNTTIVCQNISTLLNVDVLYSRIDLNTILNQRKVLAVTFSFQNLHNYSFSLSKKNNSSSLDVLLDLVNRVSFYDITSEKTKKFVDPPSLDLRLPYDFFYPFIRVGNGISLFIPNIVVIIICLYWSYLFQ